MDQENFIRFDRFELDLERRRLFRDRKQLTLTSKAFDVLAVLVEHRGELVTKDRLLDLVWEGQFVEENNLTVHIAALRKVLGEQKNEKRFIVTVSGSGYKFVAPIRDQIEDEPGVLIERHEVRRIVVEEAEGESVPTTTQDVIRSGRQYTYLSLAVAAGILLMIVVTAGWYYAGRNGFIVGSASEKQLTSRVFTAAGGVPQRVSLSRDGSTIVYSARENGKDVLWLGDLETGGSRPLSTVDGRLYNALAFSPDGRTVYFTARDQNHPVWTLMSVSAFGGAVKDIISGVHSSVALSPDGSEIAFIRIQRDRSSLIIADTETGKRERVLLQAEAPLRTVSHGISWSPDGGSIVIGLSEDGKKCHFSTVSLAEGVTGKVTEMNCDGGSNVAWFPDGSRLALITGSHPNGGNLVGTFSLATATGTPLSAGKDRYTHYALSISENDRMVLLSGRTDPEIRITNELAAPSNTLVQGTQIRLEGSHGLGFAPDGKFLFAANKGEARVIWERNADGSEERQLTAPQENSKDEQISVTADNRYLVFESDRSGQGEIWRSYRDGSSPVQLTIAGGAEPDVTPDGRSIIYRSGKYLWRIGIDGGEPQKLTEVQASWPAVSPDGEYVAALIGRQLDAEPNRVGIFPVNGGALLKTVNLTINAAAYNRIRWAPDGKSIIYKDTVDGLWQLYIDQSRQRRLLDGFEGFRVHHFAFSPDGKLLSAGGTPMREIVILEDVR